MSLIKLFTILTIVSALTYFGIVTKANIEKAQNIVDFQSEAMQEHANSKATLINNFLIEKEKEAVVLSSMEIFREVVKYPYDNNLLSEANSRIQELKEMFPGIGVLNKNGIIVVAENNPPGTDYSYMPIFPLDINSKFGYVQYYDSTRKEDYFGIFVPMYESPDKKEIIGMIGYDIKLSDLNQLVNNLNNNSYDVYVTNSEGLLITNSKYIGNGNKNGVLIQEIESESLQDCFDDYKKYDLLNEIVEHEESVSIYTSYMGEQVLGTHAYVPHISGCVIAEIPYTDPSVISIKNIINNFINNGDSLHEY